MGMGLRAAGLMAVACGAGLTVGGCCNCDTQRGRIVDPTKLPPPISMEEQLGQLEARMERIPRLTATAQPGGVTIDYVDEKGMPHHESAEGTLVLRQRFGEEAMGGRDPADVRLFGRAFDQTVFEAGRNSTDWWFVLYLDVKTVWTGDSHEPVQFAGGRGPASRAAGGIGILRADVVPALLGVSPWAIRPAADEVVTMKVDDFLGVNSVMALGRGEGGMPESKAGGTYATLRREVVVNRMTGKIDEVRLYNQGVMVMRSILGDYRAVELAGAAAEGAATQQAAPEVPFRVTLEYPARKMSIGLKFEKVVIRARDAQYDTPEFETMGLTIKHVGGS